MSSYLLKGFSNLLKRDGVCINREEYNEMFARLVHKYFVIKLVEIETIYILGMSPRFYTKNQVEVNIDIYSDIMNDDKLMGQNFFPKIVRDADIKDIVKFKLLTGTNYDHEY